MFVPLRYPVSARERAEYPDYGCGYACAPYEHTTDVLSPNVSCPHKTMGHTCRNRHCLTHGHHERRRQAVRRMRYDYQGADTYSCTLQYGGWVSYGQFSEVRKRFVAGVRAVFGKVPYWFNAEFENGRPHIHFVFRLPLGSDIDAVSGSVRKCWRESLPAGNIPWHKQRVGVALVGKTRDDVRRLFGYIGKTNPAAYTFREARPVGWRMTTFTTRDWCEAVDCHEPEDGMTTAEIMVAVGVARCGLGLVVQPTSNETVSVPSAISYITLTAPLPAPLPIYPRAGAGRSGGRTRECNVPNGRWDRNRTRTEARYKFGRTRHDTS